ncbi:hypothetical protein BASA50_002102 [Batrachochytrium salamandrivorans]|uniref:Signal peptidase complex subunit 1 n=1 Tax=Batrachochytrium salamandrivorans TaxID=1357716 RepID=A0ABQ8FMD4_9FUNG|nr:hypothetical protein BASA62_009534 [Batrachochytrium salamandrivorans]KAH6580929.1 hypothetical protein BASA60_002675 [Batrachochytrium salamandrivorans]KAH6585840.1 hypothetical protein BASA61_006677 [Batrachochytrium salamandrivorans]KAH6600719.1 hypothetical protein BASA50_002102 [Batrachochytrium salamandrivorans]KAH9253041.1 hypothetical protein BASA81_009046 [Batrachochytrium salamandrivorans]
MNILQSGKIDFHGQRLADKYSTAILTLTGVVGFVAGFATDSVLNTVIVDAVGLVLTCLICLPAWPMYNTHPVKWLEKEMPLTSDDDGSDNGDDTKKTPKQPKKVSVWGFISRILF